MEESLTRVAEFTTNNKSRDLTLKKLARKR
jgi:hypothetical protein